MCGKSENVLKLKHCLSNFSLKFDETKYANWMVAIVFAFSIFLKNILCYYCVFHSILISSLWSDTSAFFAFYLDKLAPALLLAAFVFLFKSKTWTIYLNFVLDIWIISNLFYYNANELFIDVPAILMAGNMVEYSLWDSLLVYWQHSFLVFPVISILYTVFVVLYGRKQKYERQFVPFLALIISAFLVLIPVYYYNRMRYWKPFEEERIQFAKENNYSEYEGYVYHNQWWRMFIPYEETCFAAKWGCPLSGHEYLRCHSICSYFPAIFIWNAVADASVADLNPSDVEVPGFCFNRNNAEAEFNPTPLIVILFESFESWIFENDEVAAEVMPNIHNLLTKENVLFCSKVKSQVKAGVSGDGQLIVNTGLLPVASGVTTAGYSGNTFPNFAHFYDSALVVNSCPNIWNQNVMTYKYGYKEEINADSVDSYVFRSIEGRMLQEKNYSFCALGITIASHSPFNRVPEKQFKSVKNVPSYLNKYLSCLNYTDSCFGNFLSLLPSNATLVITGDHTIFKGNLIRQFSGFAEENGFTTLYEDKNCCPLIVYSPQITSKTVVDEVCYQMDIYPTILHLIGCDGYCWHGFGVNLLDSTARHNRLISPEEASALSDKMIRADYFRNYLNYSSDSTLQH